MIGETLSHYRITGELGRGGMGVVYRAHDERLQRDVAIKVLPPKMAADPKAKDRFIQEARAASALDHPNVCSIYDIGETTAGELFMVMPLYEGRTLKEVFDGGRMPVQEAASLARQTAKGLASAHAAGIVHRDVKPANLMVLEDGLVKVLDFGVAKLGEGADLTMDGSTVGTAAYMSPEQAQGGTVDARSDLWSLGVILYEALSGERPFAGAYDQAVIYGILNADPEPLADVPADLAAVVRRLMTKDPAARYADAGVVAADLKPFTSDGGSTTTGTMAVSAPPNKKKAVIASSAFMLFLFVVVAVWSISRGGEDDGPQPLPALAVLPFDIQGDDSIAYLSDGLPTLISSKIDGMGDLRAVDPLSVRTALRDLNVEVIDTEVARDVASAFNAEGVVVGTVTRIGRQITLRAAIYGPDGTPGEATEVSVDADTLLPAAIDDLSRGLIAGRYAGRDLTSVGALTSHNFDALRHYLTGTALLREADWQEAAAAFERALDEDSSFAMAAYQLSASAGWAGVSVDVRRPSVLRASRHADGLPRRARMLIAAQRAFAQDSIRSAIDQFERITDEFPDDAHAWFRLGDLRHHYHHLMGYSQDLAYEAFNRAIELDPGNREVASHLLTMEAARKNWERFDQYRAEGYEPALETNRDVVDVLRLAEDDLSAALSTIGPETTMGRLSVLLGLSQGTGQYRLMDAVLDSMVARDTTMAPLRSLMDNMFGRFRSASTPVSGDLAAGLFGVIFPRYYFPEADSLYPIQEEIDIPPGPPMFEMFGTGVLHERFGRLSAAADTAAALIRMGDPAAHSLGTTLGMRVQLRLGRPDSALALANRQELLIDPTNTELIERRYLLGEIHRELGNLERSLEYFRSISDPTADAEIIHSIYAAPAYLRTAELHEELGNMDEAIRRYEIFLDLWRDADPEAQYIVEDARARRDALLDRAGRES